MPRRKVEEQEPEEDESSDPGKTIQPLEDFIRKLSDRFREEVEIVNE